MHIFYVINPIINLFNKWELSIYISHKQYNILNIIYFKEHGREQDRDVIIIKIECNMFQSHLLFEL